MSIYDNRGDQQGDTLRRPESHSPETPLSVLAKLSAVREDLLRVHRTLLQVERIRYEKVHGRIANSGLFLQLVIADPWFDWLRPMGQMVLLIDERMEDKNSPLEPSEAQTLLARARELLKADAQGDAFQRLYYQALQSSPELAVLHRQVALSHRTGVTAQSP